MAGNGPPKTTLAWLITTENTHGTNQLIAYLVYEDPKTGELSNPMRHHGPADTEQYADLTVRAYYNVSEGSVYGQRATFTPFMIDSADHATSIAKMMRKITTGLDALNTSQGYLEPTDFAGFLFRVASILKVTRYYIRNTDKQRNISGEANRFAQGHNVKWWAKDVLTGEIKY